MAKKCFFSLAIVLSVLFTIPCDSLAVEFNGRSGRSPQQFNQDVSKYLGGQGADVLGAKRTVVTPSWFGEDAGGQFIRVGNRLFVAQRNSSRETAFYDLETNTWSDGPNLPNNTDNQGAVGKSADGDTVIWTIFEDGLSTVDAFICDVSAETCQDAAEAGFLFSGNIDQGGNGGMNGNMPRHPNGDTLYYAGGFEEAGEGNAFLGYNIRRDTWVRYANIPDTTDQGSLSPVVQRPGDGGDTRYIYHMSGEVNSSGEDDNFYRYNVDADTWVQLSDIPTALDGEGGEFLQSTWGESDQIIAFQQGDSSGEAGEVALFNTIEEDWGMISRVSPAGFNMTQLSMEFISSQQVGNLTTVTVATGSQRLWWDSIAFVTLKFYDAE